MNKEPIQLTLPPGIAINDVVVNSLESHLNNSCLETTSMPKSTLKSLKKTRRNTIKAKKAEHSRKTRSWKGFDEEITNNYNQPELDFSKMSDAEIQYKVLPLSDDTNICVKCNSILYVYESEGVRGCSNPKCALLCSKIIDHGQEWRYFGADDSQTSDPTRCGMPTNTLLKESSMGCTVLNTSHMSYEMKKIKKYAGWQSMPHNEKILNDDFRHIECMSKISNIPKIIINDAMYIHKKISEHETSFRGSNRDGVLGASIYISCIINNYPRTSTEIAEVFNFDKSSVTKGCKDAIKIINDIDRDLPNEEKISFNDTKPIAFMARFCSKLGMNSNMTKLCEFVSIKIDKLNLMPENVSYSVVAGIIYFVSNVCNLNISKREIFDVTNISEVTIGKCFKKIETYKYDILPSVILKKERPSSIST
jgi:transcription initiation factor TFIIB